MFLDYKESHMDQAGIKPMSAWWQTTWKTYNLLNKFVFL